MTRSADWAWGCAWSAWPSWRASPCVAWSACPFSWEGAHPRWMRPRRWTRPRRWKRHRRWTIHIMRMTHQLSSTAVTDGHSYSQDGINAMRMQHDTPTEPCRMATVKHDTAVSYDISLLFCINPHLLLFRCSFSASTSFFRRFGASARGSSFSLRLEKQ